MHSYKDDDREITEDEEAMLYDFATFLCPDNPEERDQLAQANINFFKSCINRPRQIKEIEEKIKLAFSKAELDEEKK